MECAGKRGGIRCPIHPVELQSRRNPVIPALSVIPAQAGIQRKAPAVWIPAFAGMMEKPNMHIYCRWNDQKIDLSIFFATPCIYIGEPLE